MKNRKIELLEDLKLYDNHSDPDKFRIVKRDIFRAEEQSLDKWYIYIGDWAHGETAQYSIDFKTTCDIVVSTRSLQILSELLWKVVKLKPTVDWELDFPFIENKPQFKIKVKYKIDNYIINEGRRDSAEYVIVFSINALFAHTDYKSANNKYLSEGGGRHIGLVVDLNEQRLIDFIKQIEQSVGKRSLVDRILSTVV